MIRIGISVEGLTEIEFCNSLLRPYFFNKFQANVTAINMKGNISVDRIASEIKKMQRGFNVISTFYDLYGFKGENNPQKNQLENKIKKAVTSNLSPGKKFVPYVQQYEFEALLFSEVNIIANHFPDLSLLTKLMKIIDKAKHPENINNDPNKCPSKRLKSCIGSYNKATHGPIICEDIGLSKIRQKCTGFDEWLGKLENAVNSFP